MYYPQPGDEGLGLVKVALRDYLAADLTANNLPSITALLPKGAASIIDEGQLSETTPTPVVMMTYLGDGQVAAVPSNSLCRFILYVIDRGRGLSNIERIVHRLRKRLNEKALTMEFLTFPPGTDIRIEDINASGSTASASLPAWKAEARGVYVFVTVYGLTSKS